MSIRVTGMYNEYKCSTDMCVQGNGSVCIGYQVCL